MKNFFGFVLLASVAAATATYYRYESFNPCIWMEQEFAEDSGLPRLVVQGRIKAEFFLRGISEPTIPQCTMAWWSFRIDHLPKQKPEQKS